MLKKLTNKIIALLLCLITATGYVIATGTAKIVSAAAPENYSDYDPDDLSEYLTGYDIDDSDNEEEEERLYNKYSEYVHKDEDDKLLVFEDTQLKEYCNSNDDNDEISTYDRLMQEPTINTDVLDCYDVKSFEEDVRDEYVIYNNIRIINDAVAEDLGHIEGDELIIDSDDSIDCYSTRKKPYGSFKLTWYKVYIELDPNLTTLVSISFIIIRMFSDVRDIGTLVGKLYDYARDIDLLISDAICNVLKSLSDFLTEIMDNEILSYIVDIAYSAADIWLGSKVMNVVFKFIIKYFIPSYEDSLILLANAVVHGYGMSLNICWFPWKGKAGTTVRSIWF